jgi:hypothetical protein
LKTYRLPPPDGANFQGLRRFNVRTQKATAANDWKERREAQVALVTVEIDVEEIIATLGHKAMHNKSGKAIALGGLITVRVNDRRQAL